MPIHAKKIKKLQLFVYYVNFHEWYQNNIFKVVLYKCTHFILQKCAKTCVIKSKVGHL